MTFKKKIMVVLSLGVVVVVVQMLSMSILSSEPPPRLPWVEDGGAHRDTRGGVGFPGQSALQVTVGGARV